MTSLTYIRPKNSTFFTSGSVAQSVSQFVPTVIVRTNSEQSTTVGVHVKGNLRVQLGQSNSISVTMDPAALGRRMAIEQIQRETQGQPSALSTKR